MSGTSNKYNRPKNKSRTQKTKIDERRHYLTE